MLDRSFLIFPNMNQEAPIFTIYFVTLLLSNFSQEIISFLFFLNVFIVAVLVLNGYRYIYQYQYAISVLVFVSCVGISMSPKTCIDQMICWQLFSELHSIQVELASFERCSKTRQFFFKSNLLGFISITTLITNT